MYRTMARVRKCGFVETVYGYPLRVEKSRAYAGVDYIVQGSVGDLVKYAMVEVYKYLQKYEPSIKLLLQVHDEIVLEAPKSLGKKRLDIILSDIVDMMEDNGIEGFNTPVDVSICTKNWGTKKEWKRK